jgi:hypothetical protein
MIFDPANKRIIVPLVDSSSVELSWSYIWSRWIDWVATDDNGKYLPALAQVGGNPIGSGRYLPLHFFLLNNWRLRPMERSHVLTLEGSASVLDAEDDPVVVNTLGSYNVSTQYKVPVLAQGISTSGSSLTAAEIASAVVALLEDSSTGGLTDSQAAQLTSIQRNTSLIPALL